MFKLHKIKPGLLTLVFFATPLWAQQDVLTLNQLFEQALAQNPAVEERYWQQQTAQSRLEESKASLLPQVRLQSEVSYAWMEMDSFARTANQLQLTYPLYAPALSDTQAQAAADLEAWTFLHEAAQQETLLKVARLYYQYWQTRAEEHYLQKDQDFLRQTLQQLEQRLSVGYQDFEDVAEVKARLDKSQSDLIRIQARLGFSLNALSEQVGASLQGDVLAEPEVFPSQVLTMPEDLSRAVEGHPLIQALKQQSEALQQEMRRQRDRDGVKVEAFGTLVYNESDNRYYDDMRGTRGGVRVEWPLYLGGATGHRIAQAKGRLESKVAAIRQQRLLLQKTARDAWLGLQSAQRQLAAMQAARQSSQQAFEAAEQAIHTGKRSFIDLIDAQRALNRVERDLALLHTELGMQWVNLNWSLGQLNLKTS
jgi:outer membrane protein